ncbi:related to sexual differentiation and meiosis protein ste20 [Cephalotrichum gorgonifer]|uniref:Related to sexual differentiation and meiosis protein ste20 n=1 Tax=Cephalotrichum gorgonifer TaxID=2041049 RepID=A0AAE8N156_9PEZI|nr:related to sexual differentiation and meiosis protein ste20 [Cephalotrichum gorgonifer]
MLSNAATPTQKAFPPQQNPSANPTGRTSLERDGNNGLQPPLHLSTSRMTSASGVSFVPRGGSSLNPNTGPGSFSADLRSHTPTQRSLSRGDTFSRDHQKPDDENDGVSEQNIAGFKDALNREVKIKEGTENMLEALNNKKAKQTKEQRARVEAELNSSNLRIKELRQKISDAQRTRVIQPTTPTRQRTTEGLLQSNGFRSPHSVSRSGAASEAEEPTESPTFALTELLQALEAENMTPDYYVSRANALVDLFKRHPTLKYDLVWSVFGLRMQVMLLSESREVVAAGYRVTRYAISDIASLRKIRSLRTDYLVVTSLIKDRKADVEREQALKFVRAFLDLKDGVREISRSVVRTIAAIAEHVEDRTGARPAIEAMVEREDRLRPICIETLAEIFIRDPQLLIASGGLAPLYEALSEGTYKGPEGLSAAFLYLLDSPQKRKYLQPGYSIEALFSPFTDQLLDNEGLLKQNSKAIAASLKTWPGLMALSMYDFRTVKSFVECMLYPSLGVKETVIDLLYSLLRIKSPGWAQSYLAGRRLTTYGRVASLRATTGKSVAPSTEEDSGEQNFVEHYTALLLTVFIKSNLLPVLLKLTQCSDDPTLTRKTTLLLGEVLKLASRLLLPTWSSELQLLPELFAAATQFDNEAHFNATSTIYQISSVSRTLYRTTPSAPNQGGFSSGGHYGDLMDDHPKSNPTILTDDATFRQLLIDSGVLTSSNYAKWDWDVIMKIIEGPLQSGKRLEEAVKASKFLKRIVSFYRPFKYKFPELKNTRNTQKYVRVGCALMHSLLHSQEGVRYLADSKLLKQLAECLAQCDPTTGFPVQYPLFSKERLTETLCGGYIPMLGVLSGDPKGLALLDKWRIFNMMYHIVDLKQRPDLTKLILSNLDYGVNGHPRVLLSKALTAGSVDIRIHATDVLRKYAIGSPSSHQPVADSKWAIQLLVTQLYDPDIEVCSTAIKILEKACNRKVLLEYIVECRPSLDHLGEIGAPLLLRFLSTSIGYKYLDGLDYISNEMDDWFLGRNDTYVSLIEASLARSFMDNPDDHQNRVSLFDDASAGDFHDTHVPPHFYRELTRTQEGCRLLSDKGHFEDFAATIREHGMQSEDSELITKVKGCMWAVGNVGSMELGAPFIESSDVVEQIVHIAQSHEIMSLRGTAFFVLGLISRSVHGLEMLYEHGWDANTTPMGNSLGFCLPTDVSKFFSLAPWVAKRVTHADLPDTQKTEKSAPPPMVPRPPLEPQEALTDESDEAVNQRVLEIVVDLSNSVLFKRAMGELVQFRHKRKGGFTSVRLFRQIMALLEYNHYRLPIRKVVTELFHKSVLRQVVFLDDGEDGGEEEEEDDDDDDDDEDEGVDEGSGDDTQTERQRSVSESRR